MAKVDPLDEPFPVRAKSGDPEVLAVDQELEARIAGRELIGVTPYVLRQTLWPLAANNGWIAEGRLYFEHILRRQSTLQQQFRNMWHTGFAPGLMLKLLELGIGACKNAALVRPGIPSPYTPRGVTMADFKPALPSVFGPGDPATDIADAVAAVNDDNVAFAIAWAGMMNPRKATSGLAPTNEVLMGLYSPFTNGEHFGRLLKQGRQTLVTIALPIWASRLGGSNPTLQQGLAASVTVPASPATAAVLTAHLTQKQHSTATRSRAMELLLALHEIANPSTLSRRKPVDIQVTISTAIELLIAIRFGDEQIEPARIEEALKKAIATLPVAWRRPLEVMFMLIRTGGPRKPGAELLGGLGTELEDFAVTMIAVLAESGIWLEE